jgi:arylsulfatase A-like enzyme
MLSTTTAFLNADRRELLFPYDMFRGGSHNRLAPARFCEPPRNEAIGQLTPTLERTILIRTPSRIEDFTMRPCLYSLGISGLAIAAVLLATTAASAADTATKPNIVFILADDLGYGDLGCYGQKRIHTPNIDRLAKEGLRFTQCYAGSTVCAPSRCCLMTGKHTGHANVRGNKTVPVTDTTIADVLKKAGYHTALIGKWGLGEAGSIGVPNKRGFDFFFGYLNQVHAHNYYPDYLWRNQEKVTIAGNEVKNGVAFKRARYSPDLFTEEVLGYLNKHKDGPFFLYLAYILPHANNEKGNADGNGMEVPSDKPYSNQSWPQPQKNHAAMITHLDDAVGQVMKKLKDLGIDDNTIVFFSSDNGPHQEGGADPKFFQSAGPLRGLKRDLTEGGIRVPMIVRWKGVIKPGESDLPWAFWDVLPTAAELAGTTPPAGIDGLSVAPTLRGKGEQKKHDFLYWEFHERGSQMAVRMGDWKAIRKQLGSALELYDLSKDFHEDNNLAAKHPDVIKKIEAYLKSARSESKEWPLIEKPMKK